MKKNILLVVLAHILTIATLSAQTIPQLPTTTDGLLELLDQAIEQRFNYIAIRRAKADSLRQIIKSTSDPAVLIDNYAKLGVLEGGLSTDSATVAFDRGLRISREIGDSASAERLIILRVREYFNVGKTHESLDELGDIFRRGPMEENRLDFARTAAKTLINLGAFYNYNEVGSVHMDNALINCEEWLKFLEPGTPEYLFCEGLKYLCENQPQQMAKSMHECVDRAPVLDEYYPVSNIMLGEYYWEIGNEDKAAFYYAQSALGNIYGANLEGLSLLRLGELLYSMGQSQRAHRYLAVALEKAIQADEKFNLMRINNAYIEVANIVDDQRDNQMMVLISLIAALLILLAIVVKMIHDKRREVKNLSAVRQRLAQANLAKETYIKEFMNLSSDYLESIEEYNKMCGRKLTARQYDDLQAYIKSGRVVEDARRKFYDVFDKALLQLLPDFVVEVNRLLQPDKQITAPEGTLNTELRIAALARLGIDDASVIARFLGISNNTIYTYRNRLRTRAIDRNTFEDAVRKIGILGHE